jgi:GTPase
MAEAVAAVLAEIGADELPVLHVLNKIDRVDAFRRRRLANRFLGAPQVSAQTGAGIEELQAAIADHFSDRFELVRLLLPYEAGAKLAELYALGAPIEERIDRPDGVLVHAHLPRRDLRRFAPYLVAEAEHRASR